MKTITAGDIPSSQKNLPNARDESLNGEIFLINDEKSIQLNCCTCQDKVYREKALTSNLINKLVYYKLSGME